MKNNRKGTRVSTKIEKYYKAVNKLRETPPGTGAEYHGFIYYIAHCAKEATCVPADVVESDILNNTVPGGRLVSPREIQDTVANVYGCEVTNKPRLHGTGVKPVKKTPVHAPAAFDNIIRAFKTMKEADLIKASPVSIPGDPRSHGSLALQSLYASDDFLYLGPQNGTGMRCVKPCRSWLKILENAPSGLPRLPHIILNPLTGREGLCKDGVKLSLRADSCVAIFRFCIIEFDTIPIEKQIAFWGAMLDVDFPVAALVHSGGKSLHGWVRVSCKNYAQWQSDIENGLFVERLIPLGADRMCRNPSRMSRLPGHFREDKGQWQRLLYLNPDAGRVKR